MLGLPQRPRRAHAGDAEGGNRQPAVLLLPRRKARAVPVRAPGGRGELPVLPQPARLGLLQVPAEREDSRTSARNATTGRGTRARSTAPAGEFTARTEAHRRSDQYRRCTGRHPGAFNPASARGSIARVVHELPQRHPRLERAFQPRQVPLPLGPGEKTMSKRQLSILIASLFVAAPVLAQEHSTRSCPGAGHRRRHLHRLPAAPRTPRSSPSTGPVQRDAVQHRRRRPQQHVVGRRLRRELRPRGHVRRTSAAGIYDVFKAQAYTNWIPHDFLTSASRRTREAATANLAADLPEAEPRDLEQRRPRLRAQGHRRLFRVAEELAVVLPRRRQPGEDRRHQGRCVGERDEPGQRLRRHRHPGRLRRRTTRRSRPATRRRR